MLAYLSTHSQIKHWAELSKGTTPAWRTEALTCVLIIQLDSPLSVTVLTLLVSATPDPIASQASPTCRANARRGDKASSQSAHGPLSLPREKPAQRTLCNRTTASLNHELRDDLA